MALPSTSKAPPTHSVTFEALHWPSVDSAGAPFPHALVHAYGETIPLARITLDGGLPLTLVHLVESIRWDQVTTAVVTRAPDGWETLLVVGEVNGLTVAVSVPTSNLTGAGGPTELGNQLAAELQILADSARMSSVGDNLHELLACVTHPEPTQP